MSKPEKTADIRREYGALELNDNALPSNPFALFSEWLSEVISKECNADPTAMVLSTVDEKGLPDSRVVLLKSIEAEKFIFYTNYHSTKAREITYAPYGALNFYWEVLARQVRIRGSLEKLEALKSDAYFLSRPRESNLAAIASHQSQPISSRKMLEQSFERTFKAYEGKEVVRPDYWGGYAVCPQEFEFWQGRDNRLHDRIQFQKIGNEWKIQRLQP